MPRSRARRLSQRVLFLGTQAVSAAGARRRTTQNEDCRHPQRAVWAGDITCVWTTEGWAYLAVLIDLHSRKVVGWALRKTLGRELAIATLQKALLLRRPPKALMHHTDRGCQCASCEYRRILAESGLLQSMSRAGNCHDNAVSASFFATIKKELIHRQSYATRTEAYDAIADYIDSFYNPVRRPSTIGYRSPVEQELSTQSALAA